MHIGFSGTPANMRTSRQGVVTSGEFQVTRPSLDEITVQLRRPAESGHDHPIPVSRPGQLSGSWPAPGERAGQLSGSWSEPPQSLPVEEAAEFIDESDIDEEFEGGRRRVWPWVLALVGTAASIAAWQLWPDSPAPAVPPTIVISAAEVPAQPPEFPAPAPPPIPASVLPIDAGESDKGEKPSRSGEKPDVVWSPGCRQARDRTQAAFSLGEWDTVELLTRRKECWAHVRDAYVLRLRALFELGRFDDCIKFAERDDAAVVKKWKKTCEDAKS